MKSTLAGVKSILPTDFPSIGVPWLMSAATALYQRAKVADKLPPVANVVISNVPGPPVPLYMAGAKMLTNYPCSIVVHGVALNITVQSYDQSLDFGLMADAAAMPEVRELAARLRVAFDELRAMAVDEPDAEVVATARRVRPGPRRASAGPAIECGCVTCRTGKRPASAAASRAARPGIPLRWSADEVTPHIARAAAAAPRRPEGPAAVAVVDGGPRAVGVRRAAGVDALAQAPAAGRRPPGDRVPRPRRRRHDHRAAARPARDAGLQRLSVEAGLQFRSARRRARGLPAPPAAHRRPAWQQGQPDRLEPGRPVRARAGQGDARACRAA